MPEYSAMSAMSRSRMPQKTKFAYTRSPEAVAHQPVPANARIALKTSKPATTNIKTAAKVTIPGLCATVPPERSMGSLIPPDTGSLCCAISSLLFCLWPLRGLRFVYNLFHLLGVRSNLLFHLFLGALGRLLDRPLDRHLADHDQGHLALVEHLADLLEVRVGHTAPEVADEGASSSSYRPANQDRGGEDQPDRRADRQTRPAAVLGGLLGLVDYLYLALLVLGEDGGVEGSHEVLAVELLEFLEVCLGFVHVVVFARVHKHRVIAHFGLPSAFLLHYPLLLYAI